MNCSRPVIVENKINGAYLEVPCGHCMNCRLRKSQELKFVCDRYLYQEVYRKGLGASFVTLTYNDNSLPLNKDLRMTLRKKDLQKLLNRSQMLSKRHFNIKFKYIACGEYGDKQARPHYHLCVLGLASQLARDVFSRTWNKDTYGFIDVGVLRQGGLHYITNYMTKAPNGSLLKELYTDNDIEPPFLIHSVRFLDSYIQAHPEIIENNFTDTYFKGNAAVLPAYYRKKYDRHKNFSMQEYYKTQYQKAKNSGFDHVADYQKAQAILYERINCNQSLQNGQAVYKNTEKIKNGDSRIVKSIIDDIMDPIPF